MAESECNISVVIPTKNGGDLFREVLSGIRSQVFDGEIEVLVIDSGSTDHTLTLAKEYGAEVSTIEPGTFNHGLTRNLGIERATGEFVVLITQDAVPGDAYLLRNLVKAFSDPMVAGAYARQVPRDDADVLTKRNLNGWLTGRTVSDTRSITDKDHYLTMSPFEQYMFCNFDNVCSAVRKTAWQDVPFNRCDFGEDIDWSKRILEAGWKISYQPESHVIHSHSRPISYEYKRTYMCHRKLYELFKLCTVPSMKYMMRSFLFSLKADFKYAIDHETKILNLVLLLMRIPFLSLASAYGQFRGAQDERLHRGVTLGGV